MDRPLASRVELVPFLDDHVPLVEGWLRSEHVRRWCVDLEGAISDLRDPSRRSRRRIIVLDDPAVGYVRWEPENPPKWAAMGLDVRKGVIDIGIFIGTKENLGRGIGSAAIGKLVGELGSHVYVATTSISNIASRRAFQKAGFVEKQVFQEAEAGRMTLMVRVPK
jgi:RimJ/RimL family protein N-acetyltransferase